MDKIKRALQEKKELSFDVTEPRKSFAGYTVYRLQLKVLENTSTTVPIVEFLGWKRFNDFKKLHKQLKAAFPVTFRQGFNDFMKGKFFGRFDETLIEERRQTSVKLLMFILLYPEMFSHKAFVNFIEPADPTSSSPRDTISPAARDRNTSSFSSMEDLCDEATDESTAVAEPETVLLASAEDQRDDVVVGDFDGIDNLAVQDAESDDNEDEVFINVDGEHDGRQSWLREARSLCGDDVEGLASEADESFPITPRLDSGEDTSVLFGEPLGEDILCSTPEKQDGDEAVLKDGKSTENNDEIDCPAQQEDVTQNKEENNSIADDGSSGARGSTRKDKFQERLKVDARMSEIISRTVEEDDYVFQASVAMSNAIDQETLGNVDNAFNMYKFGIGLLLRGVQTDTDVDRREAVRRKTAQYLLRAEELYQSTMQRNHQGDERGRRNGTMSSTTPTSTASIENKWRFRLSDVKVIGVADKVMLVQKVFSADDVFVMKVLHKQGAEYKRTNHVARKTKKSPRNLYNCQFMAALLNCVETKTGVYLLLEHVTGGKLWDYLGLPIFPRRHHSNRSSSTIPEMHHSWGASDCNSSFVEQSLYNNDGNDVDIVDIPTQNYVGQGLHDLSSSFRTSASDVVTCRIKRSPSKSATLSEANVKFWAAQIALTLMDLHVKRVICRDLNPRNILIDAQGNIRLTYFSSVEGIDYSLNENAVQFLYTSPEVDRVFEPSSATDWWSFGAILFELLTGEALYSCHPDGIKPSSIITLPRRVSNEACALLSGLLKYNPKERLGSGPNGNEEIKAHPFFHDIDWESFNKK